MDNGHRHAEDLSLCDDPVLAQELVKILAEVEGRGCNAALTPPTVPPSDTTGAGYDTPLEVASHPARIASRENPSVPPPRTAIGKDRGSRDEDLEEANNEVQVHDLALRPIDAGPIVPSRPETAHHGLEVGPETCQRWMPRREGDLHGTLDGASETRAGVTWPSAEDTPVQQLTLEDVFPEGTPEQQLTLEDVSGCREQSKATTRLPDMKDLLQNLWAVRAVEQEAAKGRRRQSASDWQHGEIYFEETGKVCRYLVAPNGDVEAADVVRVLLDVGFGLPQPEMLFSVQSAPGNYWHADEEIESLRSFGVGWPDDPDEAKEMYRRNVESLMLGVCTAASECGAWLLGSGQRTGGEATGALFEAGIRQFMRLHPDRENDLSFIGLRGPCCPDVLEHVGLRPEPSMCPYSTLVNPMSGDLIDLRRTAVSLWEEVSEQVRYPDVGELWTQRVSVTSEGMAEAIGCMCLNPTLSHLVLCTDLVRRKLHDFLERLLPSVHVVACGQSRGCLDYAMDRALRGTQVLVLQNSGVWANVLSKSVLERKGLCGRADYVAVNITGERPLSILDQVDVSKFLVFDVLIDNEERVVEKITNTLTPIAGDEVRELGFSTSERQRLQHAWDLYLLYTLNARRMLFWSRVAHYTFTVISLLTTTFAVLLTASSLPESGSNSIDEAALFSYEQIRFSRVISLVLAVACSLLPLMSALLLSVNSRFSPRTKYASFTASAAKVRSALYKYRARVGEYMPGVRNALMHKLDSDCGRRPLQRWFSRFRGPPPPAPPRAQPTPPHQSLSELREAARSMPGMIPGSVPYPARETAPAGWGPLGCSRSSAAPVRFGPAGGSRLGPVKELVSMRPELGTVPERRKELCPKPSERFAEVLNAIHTELTAGVARTGDMVEPRRRDWEDLERSLGHRPPRQSPGVLCSCLWFRRCCCHRRSSHKCSSDPQVIGRSECSPVRTPDAVTACEDIALDDAFCLITADDYIHFRLKPLIAGLKVRAPLLARTWAATQMATFVGTAVAGAFGVLSMREYIPIVVAVVSAVDSVAQFEQLQVRMVATNSSLAELQGMLVWWNSLSIVERRKGHLKEHLINVVEDVAGSEAAVFGCSARTQVPRRPSGEDDEETGFGQKRR